jgi:hypothetical protein
MEDVIMKKTLLFPTLCLGVGKGQGCKTLEVKIELRKREYTNWDTMEKEIGYEFSACGSGLGHHGQCLDHFKEKAEQYMIDESRRELFNRVLAIWDRYHLNTLKPGTKWQMETFEELKAMVLKDKPELAEEFKKRNKYDLITKGALANESMGITNGYKPLMYDHNRGDYKYGSSWLAEPIPEDIIAEIISWNDIENFTKEELSVIRRKLIREHIRNNKAN